MPNVKQPPKPTVRQRRAAFQAAMYTSRQNRLDRLDAQGTPGSTSPPPDEGEIDE